MRTGQTRLLRPTDGDIFLEEQKKAHETRQTGAQVQELAVKVQRLCVNEVSETGVGQLGIGCENVADGDAVP